MRKRTLRAIEKIIPALIIIDVILVGVAAFYLRNVGAVLGIGLFIFVIFGFGLLLPKESECDE